VVLQGEAQDGVGMSSEGIDSGVIVRAPGGPEALEWSELPLGRPGPREALVAHRAIGVNFIDTYFRTGLYPWPTTPLVPGSEAAGVVEQVGSEVRELKPGDRVAYTMAPGAYRLRRVVPADRLVKLPDGISFEVAASTMLKGLTAQYLLNACFAVKPGHTVLVHAAAGGVGLLLGQWLKALGARAIGTVGSEEKRAVALANGYEAVVNYRSEDFVARVGEITGGRGCEVVYDSVAKDTWRGSLKCLKTRGMLVVFGQSSGVITDFKIGDLAAGSLSACRPSLFDYIRSREELEARAADLFSRLGKGEIQAHVGQRIALRQAADAHRALESRGTVGATVLLP
jgi:NADPH2:quinone reductase